MHTQDEGGRREGGEGGEPGLELENGERVPQSIRKLD